LGVVVFLQQQQKIAPTTTVEKSGKSGKQSKAEQPTC
jgi:hypothetical protein